MADATGRSPGGPRRQGRLELTWTNKDWRLLAREDGGWDWVPPSDYRVAEVRLLHEAAVVGEQDEGNLLIRGDALNALASLVEIPSFFRRYAHGIKLAYLDPPFNTRQSFLQYDDALEHSVWLTLMRDRLTQVRDLLAPDGSVWVHCDDSEQGYLRILMDELFGRDKFIATIVWQKRYSRDSRPAIGPVHDYILVYAPAGLDWKNHRNRISRDARSTKQYRNPNDDPNGPWRAIPLDVQAGHATKAQFYEIKTPGGAVHTPSSGRAWSVTQDRFEELLEQGKIYFGLNGKGKPNLIRYLSDDSGLVPWTWWPHEEVGHNDEAKKEVLQLFPDVEPFDTPKPERLMQRIIEIATNAGDVVLDCFLGSGTTAAVAHKMGRRWIGIERSVEIVQTYALPRLTKVIRGEEAGGVTTAEDWGGGGGFRVYDVGPSMFDEDKGQVILADWATNGALAEATAAQLHFPYEIQPPFCGRKGRVRLAVIDGHVSEAVAGLLLDQLDEDEQLVVCGTSLDPAILEGLRARRPGSRARKIPDSLLAEYRETHRWRPTVEARLDEGRVIVPNGDGASPAGVQAEPR